jgi:hypothetical protein
MALLILVWLVEAAAQLATPPVKATKLMLVAPDGKSRPAPDSVQLNLVNEIVQEPTNVDDVLARHGLAKNAKSRDMLKRLNPGHDFTQDTLLAGTRIELLAPKVGANHVAVDFGETPVSLPSQLPGKLIVGQQLVATTTMRKLALELPVSAFENPVVYQRHKTMALEIDRAVQTLQGRAATMTATDLAVASYQIDYATRRANLVNRLAVKEGRVGVSDLATTEKALTRVQTMMPRMMSGQSPLPLRRVKVNVFRHDADVDVKGLQVYVLPAGIVNFPELFDEDEVRNYLTRFSFVDEASPAVQIVPLFGARVWVGPKFKFDDMVRLVRAGKLEHYQPIDDPDMASPVLQLVFRAPADLVEVKE